LRDEIRPKTDLARGTLLTLYRRVGGTSLAEEAKTIRAWWRYGLLVVAVWSAVAVISAIQGHVNALGMGYESSFSHQLTRMFLNYSLFALLTPFVIVIARRFRFTREHWVVPLIAHVVGFFVFCTAWAVLRVTFFQVHEVATSKLMTPSLETLKDLWVSNFEDALWMYFPIIFLSHAVLFYHDSRERLVQESELQAQLARAQLSLLQAQLHPHFLFNTLHAVSTLMGRDVSAARAMIVRLSELLRQALESVDVQEVSLKRELEFIDNYLEIEKIRFQDRLTVQLEIAPLTLDALVPNLLLQPLVENAVRHGVAMQPGPGWVRIASRHVDDKLLIEIEDSGLGLSQVAGPHREGIGHRNTRSRLSHIYGQGQKFELISRTGKGLLISIEVPFQTVSSFEGEAFYEDRYANRG
jgi:two-component sensor histidine kinase